MENKNKRKLKTEPRLKVQLTEEQKDVIKDFYKHDVNFILGDFGSGKSLTAVYAAIAAYRKKQFNKIWITRPMLKNKLAALPGTVEEKMFPYIFPIIQNLEVVQGKAATQRMMEKGEIEIMPVDVAKGVTFMDSVVIVDEFQDMDYADFRTILTRLGKDSKMILCGSIQQVDKTIGKDSCIWSANKLSATDFVGFNVLTANHRNDTLTKIIRFLEKDEKRKTS